MTDLQDVRFYAKEFLKRMASLEEPTALDLHLGRISADFALLLADEVEQLREELDDYRNDTSLGGYAPMGPGR